MLISGLHDVIKCGSFINLTFINLTLLTSKVIENSYRRESKRETERSAEWGRYIEIHCNLAFTQKLLQNPCVTKLVRGISTTNPTDGHEI